jgi:uncharacterized protein (TIGR03067 family)
VWIDERTEGIMTRLAVLVLAIALGGSVSTQEAKDAGATALQGTWLITTLNGQAVPEGGPQLTLTFAGDKYHQTLGGDVNERGAFKLDTSKKPMTIDLTIVEGDDAGKTQLGIIEVTGDTFRASLDTPNAGQRPADFNLKDGVLVFSGKKTNP